MPEQNLEAVVLERVAAAMGVEVAELPDDIKAAVTANVDSAVEENVRSFVNQVVAGNLAGRDGTAPSGALVPQSVTSDIEQGVAEHLSSGLGIDPQNVPSGLAEAIQRQVRTALTDNIHTAIRTEASREVKDQLGKQLDIDNLINRRVGGALKGIAALGSNNDTKLLLDENARLLKLKFDALVTAGFTDDQAFSVILAELGRPKLRA
jgi:hypothetical protein